MEPLDGLWVGTLFSLPIKPVMSIGRAGPEIYGALFKTYLLTI